MLNQEDQWLYDYLKRYEQQLVDHSHKGYCSNCFLKEELYRKANCRFHAEWNRDECLEEIKRCEYLQHLEYLKTLPTV